MNGAAMNCRQDPVLRTPHQDSSSLRNPGYHLQINSQQNLQPQNSKTLNYPSFSNNYQVDGFRDDFLHYENIVESRHSFRDMKDPRFQRKRAIRGRNEPIDLPVPRFEVDEHSVSDIRNANGGLVEGSKGLDLDTRIGLLIKSKALAGMHPIFSDLNESEESESESDLDDLFLSRPRSKFRKVSKTIPSPPRGIKTPIRESFDDPEKPLSRPPSPFLSRASYLFWFNKAIEIKQQAKAQEQALLEQAAKRLIQDNSPSLKTNQPSPKKPIIKNLLEEISKELKDVIKQECIRGVIEETVFNTLDDWWDKQNQDKNIDIPKSESESLKKVSNMTNDNYQDSVVSSTSECQGSTSPKIPFPWKNELKLLLESQGEESVKDSFCYEMSENKAVEENLDKSLSCAHLVDQNKSMNSVIQPDQESQSEELSGEDNEKNCEVNCEEVACLVETNNRDIDNCAYKVPGSCESKVFVKRNEVQFLPSSDDTSVYSKIDERNLIVKSILDIIFNNVNKVVVQRNDDKTSFSNGNNKMEFHNYSKLTISVDSSVKDTTKVDSAEDFAYGSL